MNYRDALAWLYGLQLFGIKLGLENIWRLIDALHVDLGEARVIHVAGTNGKGSVCAMIDSIARAQGCRSGLFTSPHLISFRERIRVNGEMISEDTVASGLTEIRDLVASWDPHPTFFEITTALALQYFANAKIDIVVLETGLGGRLDATNAIYSNVAVITPIDLDHQKWLGDSLEQIAGEKAGIIKGKAPVVSAPQLPQAEDVIRARAAECNTSVQFVSEKYG
ncbi:MAG: dihydrofolate synthase / folylpolyglutamate synthase, partial [Verrucomicrobiota bacterium]